MEIAVPVHVPVADLLPTLVTHLDPELTESGLTHDGWVLQRLGDSPLNEDLSVGALGLYDGEMVHLRPRSEQLPPAAFDDLIDGIATALRQRPGRWQPKHTRWAALTAAALVLVTGFAALLAPGPPQWRAQAAGLLALICVAGTALFARVTDDRSAAGILGAAAVAFAALAGLLTPQIGIADTSALPLAAPNVFGAAGAGTSAFLLAGLSLGDRVAPAFLAGALAGGIVALGSGVVAFTDVPSALGPAIVAAASSLLVPMAPTIASRMAGLRMAPLPTEPEHLQENIDPEPAAEVIARSMRMDSYLTGWYAGPGIAAAGATVLLAVAGGWAGQVLAGLVSVSALLSVRAMTSARHRLAAGVPGLAGPIAVAWVQLNDAPVTIRTAVVVLGVTLLAPMMIVLSRTLPGQRLMPFWGRVGDILQVMAGVAQLPLLLTVADAYSWARGLGG